MTTPALDRLRDEIAEAIRDGRMLGRHSLDIACRIQAILKHRIPADVLAGLLDGTMVAVPVKELMFGAGDFARLEAANVMGLGPLAWRLAGLRDRAMLAAAKQEPSK